MIPSLLLALAVQAAPAADPIPAMLERAEMSIADVAYTGFATTPEEYLIEAIIDPSVYISEGEWEYAMADDYDEDLSEKDLADIIFFSD